MLYLCCCAMYAFSIFESLANMNITNSYSNRRIIEMGYEIKPKKNNSLKGNIMYFFKAYGPALIPVFNLFYSIMKDSETSLDFDSVRREYDNKRIKMLQNSGLLIKNTNKISTSKKVEPINKGTKTRVKPLAEMTCYERRDFYKSEYKKACRECKLDHLTAERNIILANIDEQKKLIRK